MLAIFGVGAVALLAFILTELFVAKQPLLDLRLFRSPTFAIATVIGYVTVIALFGAEFLMPVYLQVLRGRAAMESGLLLLPLALTSAVFTPLAGRFYDKIGPRALLIVGFGLLAINTWQLSQIQALTPMSTIMWLMALRGAALGCIVQTTMATALGAVPRTLLPRGSSLINGTRFVVQSIGVALLATLLASTSSDQTRQLQASYSERSAEGAQASFGLCETPGVPAEQNLPPALAGQPAAVQAQAKAQIDQACNEYLAGFDLDYRLTFYFALAALALGALLPGWPGPWAGRGAQQAERGGPAIAEHVG